MNIEPEHEVRFAVVMYGGVSLAIYINGVTQELLNLVRATAPIEIGSSDPLIPDGNSELEGTAGVYRKLGQYLYGDIAALRPLRKNETGSASVKPEPPVRTRFIVDVISGTSAGGINGVFLAKALARNQNMEGLKKLWLEEGDLGKLLNDPLSVVDLAGFAVKKPQESLLNSQRMYCKLLEALEQLELSTAKPQAEGKETPLVGELDLFITTTDIEGIPQPIPLSDGVVYERRYKNVFHFRYATSETTGCDRNDFLPANDPFLAFAARCTSSFPFAFEPMQLADIEPVLRDSSYGIPDKQSDEWDHFFSEYLRHALYDIDKRSRVQPPSGLPGSGKSPEEREAKATQDLREAFWSRSFGDGGYLDNKPFSHATAMLMRRTADVVVGRKLLYVEPSPGHPELTRKSRNRPDFAENVRAAMLDLPRQETIREDIDRVYERNAVINRINQFAQRLDEDLANAPPLPLMTGIMFRTSDLNAMIALYGIAYGAYHRLRVNEITALLSGIIARLAGYDPSSDAALIFREIVAAWRGGRYSELQSQAIRSTENKFLFAFDIRYRLRRISFLNRRLNTLGHVDPKGGLRSDTLELLRAWEKHLPPGQLNVNSLTSTWLADFRAELNRIKRDVVAKAVVATRRSEEHLVSCGERAARQLSPLEIAKLSPNERADYELGRRLDANIDKLDLRWRSIEQLLTCDADVRARWIRNFLRTRSPVLRSLAAIIANEFRTAYRTNPRLPNAGKTAANGADAAILIYDHYYDNFRYYDLVTYPIQYGTGVGEANIVDIFRISPEDATSLIDERGVGESRRKLAGTALMSFGAFLDRGWRKNDMLWGRLDGAERIISALLPGRDQTTTEVRNDLIKQAHVAIFREEIHSDDVDTLRLLLSNMLARIDPVSKQRARVDPVSEQQRTLREVVEAAFASEKGTLPATFQSALRQVFKDPDEIREYYRQRFEVDRQFEAETALRLISRVTNIIGRMFHGLAERLGSEPGKRTAESIARLGTIFWRIVTVAVPNSLGNLVVRHWLGLLYVLSFITLVLGTLLPKTRLQIVGGQALAVAVGINLVLFLLGDFIAGRRRMLRAVGAFFVLALVLLIGCGVFFITTTWFPSISLHPNVLAWSAAGAVLILFVIRKWQEEWRLFLRAPHSSFDHSRLSWWTLGTIVIALVVWRIYATGDVDLEFARYSSAGTCLPFSGDTLTRLRLHLALDCIFIIAYTVTLAAYCVAAAKLFWLSLTNLQNAIRTAAAANKNWLLKRLTPVVPALTPVWHFIVVAGFLLATALCLAAVADASENAALFWFLQDNTKFLALTIAAWCSTAKFLLIAAATLYSTLGLLVGIFMFPRRLSLYLFAAVSGSFCFYAWSVLLSHPKAFKIVGSYLACALISCI